ncbi:MAG: GreA/GreB family elongation factor [Bacilli bacterium]|nr:GreA/GreB family elongation factor [Bacilli bacterium]
MNEILVTEEGYKQFYEKFEDLKNSSLTNANTLSKAYNDYVGDGWHDNPAYEEAMRVNRMIDNNIKTMLEQSKKLKVINDTYDENLVNINDIVKIEFIYSEDDIENEIIKLTGKFIPNEELDICEITLNSPIGKAIYKKKIGDICSYDVANKKMKIRIIERVKI